MDHPLDDCRLKIAGAKQDVDALNATITQFAQDNPYRIRSKEDAQAGKQSIEFSPAPAFPRKWALTVGYIGGNARSALEYLVAALVREAGRSVQTHNCFPISQDRDAYVKVGRGGVTYRDRCLDGVPEPLREKIDGFQPYHHGDLAYLDPLALLTSINNADKHHTPQAAYAVIDIPSATIRLPTSDSIEGPFVIHIGPGPHDVAVEAAFKRGRGPDAMAIDILYPKVNVNPSEPPISIYPVFGYPHSRCLVSLIELVEIVSRVEEIVESFAPDFS